MSTKQDVIDAIADVATAAAALDAAITNIRDANAALRGEVVTNTAIVAGGTSTAALSSALTTAVKSMAPLIQAVDDAVATADTVANALT